MTVRDKRMSAAEVAAELSDGMTVGIGGWGSRRKPMALVRAILDTPVRDLTIVSYGGPDVGLLCAAGKVRRLVYGFVSLDTIPYDPWFQRVRQQGGIEVREFDEGMPDPEVSEDVADGKRRYLMLVCADMRRSMAVAAENGGREPVAEAEPDDGDDDIDRWIADAGARRLYGWPLDFPDRAVTVRRVDGRTVTTDGPFAETKEQIAGYDLLECSDLDDALTVASAHPVAEGGVIELRPLWR